MLDYRINFEAAEVTVSSVATEGDRLVAAVEFVRKVEPHALSECQQALSIEWKTILTNAVANDVEPYPSTARFGYCRPSPDQPGPRRATAAPRP